MTLVDVEGQKLSRSASVETIANQKISFEKGSLEKVSSNDRPEQERGANDATIIDWAQDDPEVRAYQPQPAWLTCSV